MKSPRIRLLALLLLTISMVSVQNRNQLRAITGYKLDWIKFTWAGDSSGNRYFDKATIDLPVKIQGIPHNFTFQFDLGANLSMVYGPSVEPYFRLYPDVRQKLDSSSGFTRLKNVDITIDGQRFEDRDLFYNPDFGAEISVDSAKSHTVKHIGTIGVDLFQNQVLIIDYPNTRLAVTKKVPADIANKTTFVAISLDRHGRVHLPLRMHGKERKILFDTGASLFPLFTTPENWAAVTSRQITDSILTSTWGKEYYTYGAVVDEVYLGNKKLPTATCYKNEYLANFIKEEGIWGVTGNAYFLKDVVVVDFVNKRFGLMN